MITSVHVPHFIATLTIAPPPVSPVEFKAKETTIVAPTPGMIICHEVEVGDG